jgi:hypothetical protein
MLGINIGSVHQMFPWQQVLLCQSLMNYPSHFHIASGGGSSFNMGN